MASVRVGIIGDFTPGFRSHTVTNDALAHTAAYLRVVVDSEWLPTDAASALSHVADYDALWIAPGSPYRDMDAALEAIRYGREHNVPLIGTCGGFQHIVIEYARNVLGIKDAQHAEYNPHASKLFVTPLSCSLFGQRLPIQLKPGSRASEFYGDQTEVEEEYYCNFGLNPAYQEELDRGGLRVVGVDGQGEARVLELPDHKFFIATLFVPQERSRPTHPHPLVVSFIQAAIER